MKKLVLLITLIFTIVSIGSAGAFEWNPLASPIKGNSSDGYSLNGPLLLSGPLTVANTYNTAPIWSVSNSSMLPPLSFGDGILNYNGTMLTRSTNGAVVTLKTFADTTYGVYKKSLWYAPVAAASPYDESADWTFETGWGTTEAASAIVAAPNSDGGNALQINAGPETTDASMGAYRLVKLPTPANTVRVLARVRPPLVGPGKFGGMWEFALIDYANAKDLVGVQFIYTGAGEPAALNICTSTNSISWRMTVISGVTYGIWHNIEIYVSGTTFSIKLNGTTVCYNGMTAGNGGTHTIRAMTSWAAVPMIYVDYMNGSTTGTAVVSQPFYIKQLELLEVAP